CGSGGCEPEFALLFVIAEIETVKQAETLNQPQRDDGENSCVGNDRDHAAEAEAGSFEKREALRIANQNPADSIQPVYGHVTQVAEVVDVNAVLLRKVTAESFAVDFDRAKAAFEAEAQEARKWGCQAHGYNPAIV